MRVLRIVVWLVAGLVVLAFAASQHPMVRSVYRAFRPSTSYDADPPAIPKLAAPAVLVFSKTNGFRHTEGIDAGVDALREIASRRGWSMFHTENGAVFAPETLLDFRVVVWLNVSGAPLDPHQRRALANWIERGGGFVGIHAALDDSHASWEWYASTVLGMNFIGHPLEHQAAMVRVEKPGHPTMERAEHQWSHLDEWYSFDRSVRGDGGVEVLASVDEATYDQRLRFLWIDRDLSMGDHPVIWTREVGQGVAFLSALGHRADVYRDANYLTILEDAITWAGGLAGSDTEEVASQSRMEKLD